MQVSIVIPAYNEAKALPSCLDALAKQQTNHQFEVVVVDNASTDESTKVAESMEGQVRSTGYLRAEERPRQCSTTRFSEVETDIVLSTDADTIAPRNWVESLVNALVNYPKLAAVSGSSYITDGTVITNWTMKVGMPFSLRLYRALIGHYMLTGANFAIRREIYEKAGGFDLNRDMLDDVDLSFRVSKIGRIAYLNQPKVLTEGDMFRKGYVRGFCHYARHLPPLLKKYWIKRDYSLDRHKIY